MNKFVVNTVIALFLIGTIALILATIHNQASFNGIDLKSVSCNEDIFSSCLVHTKEVNTRINVDEDFSSILMIANTQHDFVVHQNPLSGRTEDTNYIEYVRKKNEAQEKYWNLRGVFIASKDTNVCLNADIVKFNKLNEAIRSNIYNMLDMDGFIWLRPCDNNKEFTLLYINERLIFE